MTYCDVQDAGLLECQSVRYNTNLSEEGAVWLSYPAAVCAEDRLGSGYKGEVDDKGTGGAGAT